MIYQSEAAECGLACMAMVANHHGHKLDLTTLRNRYSVSFKGANMQQLTMLAGQLDLVGRALKLDLDDLKNLKTPCILHWDMNHFVVLVKVRSNSITILDPAMGERKVSMQDVDKSFTGIALELSPTAEFKKKDERVKLSIRAFWTNIEGLVPSLTKLFILSLLLQFFIVIVTVFYVSCALLYPTCGRRGAGKSRQAIASSTCSWLWPVSAHSSTHSNFSKLGGATFKRHDERANGNKPHASFGTLAAKLF
jgi:ATP-binding cassette subfamily B protein RaxB